MVNYLRGKTEVGELSNEIVVEMDYIKKNIDPIISELTVKIITDEPANIIDFMIEFLKQK